MSVWQPEPGAGSKVSMTGLPIHYFWIRVTPNMDPRITICGSVIRRCGALPQLEDVPGWSLYRHGQAYGLGAAGVCWQHVSGTQK
jgi:hypothetical protein